MKDAIGLNPFFIRSQLLLAAGVKDVDGLLVLIPSSSGLSYYREDGIVVDLKTVLIPSSSGLSYYRTMMMNQDCIDVLIPSSSGLSYYSTPCFLRYTS